MRARYDNDPQSIAHLAAMVPMILPPFVGALGFQQILGHYGVLNTLLVSCGFARVDFLGGNGRSGRSVSLKLCIFIRFFI